MTVFYLEDMVKSGGAGLTVVIGRNLILLRIYDIMKSKCDCSRIVYLDFQHLPLFLIGNELIKVYDKVSFCHINVIELGASWRGMF